MTPAELRRLLELAAKAMGLSIDEHSRNGSCWAWVYKKDAVPDSDGEMPIFRWSPYNDDGDSRRMEVALNLQVNPEIQTDHGPAATAYDGGHGIATELHNGDKAKATRMAVLRAAAAIGEAMP